MSAADLGTMIQEIQADLHTLADTTTIRRKIIDSMRFHRENRLWFSERRFSFALTANRSDYAPGDGFGLPGDVVEIATGRLWLYLNGSASAQQPVMRATPDEFDLFVASDSSSASPTWWDFQQKRLRLWPSPSNAADILNGRYVSDIGVPTTKWDAGSFIFFTPDGQPLTDDFTNDWLRSDGAAAMVRARAMHLVAKALRDPSEDSYLQLWLEEKAKLEDESDARIGGGLRLVAQL